MENDERLFYRHRDRFNALLGADRTQRGSGGALLLSESHRVQRPVPLQPPGAVQRAVRPLRAHPLHARSSPVSAAFAGWTFTSGDVEALPLRAGDFVYADPPYDVEFTQYARGGFSWRDQKRTARLAL